ncbi:hypothetical protein DP939_38930 [Spongiactinospora rosea]|uniref:Uncharacterized protein n=1 Tax=Spongiactinospora rosea TaxID=2248750 RepID=A0A366LM52_9ACTN|nr:hypothetical protein [Spongiactinospora rosea]RBQ14750.1 hypothetical protein DP939_38930 [Spongiactinospora rosea]
MAKLPLIGVVAGVLAATALALTPAQKTARRARRRALLAQVRAAVRQEKAARSERRGGTAEPFTRVRPRRPKGTRSRCGD